MRAGGCALQQALTSEASAVVRQAVLLACRRGHAQVTPLHVASTMLQASGGGGGLFRAACLGSHSHPLQCKALELCFNVALNRLPASPIPPAATAATTPSVSNALVAAFKRAQAHQRRGPSGEAHQQQQQQQTAAASQLLAVRIELEQLVIAILDDPSVSRVMREAGFSSTQVKNNVEKAVSTNNCSPRKKTCHRNQEKSKNDDIAIIIESLLSLGGKRKSLVFVGESVSAMETAVKLLMDLVDRGEVPENLREVKFITIPPLYTFCNLCREEVEQKVGELAGLVRGFLGKGVVLYLGDFKWISEYRVRLDEEGRGYYCSVEHLIMEIGRLVQGIEEAERFWLIGVATFRTYMKCRNGYNSLESLWGLHPVTIPANSLGFGLISDSDEQVVAREREMSATGDVKLSCCARCTAEFKNEARELHKNRVVDISEHRSLPFWLKDESRRLDNMNQNQNSEAVKELCKKWNSFCNSTHKTHLPLDKTLTLSYTPLSPSCFSYDKQITEPGSTRTHLSLPGPTWKTDLPRTSHPVGLLPRQETTDGDSRNHSSSNSASSSEVLEVVRWRNFKEFNGENLNIIWNALEKEVPCQKDIIPEIAGTILQCRSGMLKRKSQSRGDDGNSINHAKQETWLLFLGPDRARAKERISKELAKAVFGSYSSFISIGSSSSYIEKFGRAVSENPHRVFLLENLERVDSCSKMGIKRAIERGKIANEIGQEFDFSDAIIILSCEGFGPTLSGTRYSDKQETENGVIEEDESRCLPLDLNISLEGEILDDDDEFGIFENVDRRLVFKSHDL